MNKLAKSFVALGVVAGAAIGGLWVAQPASAAISAGCSNFNVCLLYTSPSPRD